MQQADLRGVQLSRVKAGAELQPLAGDQYGTLITFDPPKTALFVGLGENSAVIRHRAFAPATAAQHPGRKHPLLDNAQREAERCVRRASH